MIFKDRADAGRRLAAQLKEYAPLRPIIFGIPRGGVIVAHEVARALGAPLCLAFPRKIGAPGQPELALGAVGDDGSVILDDDLVRQLGVDAKYLKDEVAGQLEEVKRRQKLFQTREVALENRSIVVVDDGVATGSTIRAAVAALRKRKPAFIIVAVPVAHPSALRLLKEEADEVICLYAPESFAAVGQFYEEFEQVSDDEVMSIVGEPRGPEGQGGEPSPS